MNSLVLDASMAAAWLLPDEHSDVTDAVLIRVTAEGATVPALFRYEVRHVLLRAVRRDRITVDRAKALIETIDRLPLGLARIEDDQAILTIALHRGLTAYDAAYLALAKSIGAALATLDSKLGTAARLEGVALIGPLAP